VGLRSAVAIDPGAGPGAVAAVSNFLECYVYAGEEGHRRAFGRSDQGCPSLTKGSNAHTHTHTL
jgi:hypothetical protein